MHSRLRNRGKLSDTQFAARVALAVGPVKAKFTGKVTMSDLDPPHQYTIAGEGHGGVAGFGKGSATVRLIDGDSHVTVLQYQAQASVGGKLAQVGARLIDAAARKLAEQFFGAFASTIEAKTAQSAQGTPVVPSPAPDVQQLQNPLPATACWFKFGLGHHFRFNRLVPVRRSGRQRHSDSRRRLILTPSRPWIVDRDRRRP